MVGSELTGGSFANSLRLIKEGRYSLVDQVAHDAATSPLNNLSEPTEGQKEAGNYRKGHLNIAGLDVSIENPAGSRRRPEWPELKSHYGYFKRTSGGDGENIDVFVKPGTPADYNGPVHVVDQQDEKGDFDEHKTLIGFADEDEARRGYLENYTPGWTGLKSIRRFESPSHFKEWLETADTSKPARRSAELVQVKHKQSSTSQEGPAPASFAESLRSIKEGRYKPPASPRRGKTSEFDPVAVINANAARFGVAADLALKVMQQESGGRHYDESGRVLTSEKGARGRFQLMPSTARELGYDADDEEQNVLAGLAYLGKSLKQWNGNKALAVAGYHSGIDDAEKALKNPSGNPKTWNYARSILGDEFSKYWTGTGPDSEQGGQSFAEVLNRIKGQSSAGNLSVPGASEASGSFADFLHTLKTGGRERTGPINWPDESTLDPDDHQGARDAMEAKFDYLRSGAHIPSDGSEIIETPPEVLANGDLPITLSTDAPAGQSRPESEALKDGGLHRFTVNIPDLVEQHAEGKLSDEDFLREAHRRVFTERLNFTPEQYERYLSEKQIDPTRYPTAPGSSDVVAPTEAIKRNLRGYADFSVDVGPEEYRAIVSERNKLDPASERRRRATLQAAAPVAAGGLEGMADLAQTASNARNLITGGKLEESSLTKALRNEAEAARRSGDESRYLKGIETLTRMGAQVPVYSAAAAVPGGIVAESLTSGGLGAISEAHHGGKAALKAGAIGAMLPAGARVAGRMLGGAARSIAEGPPKTSLLDVISATRKAGLLTGVATQGRNIGGNALFQAAEEVSRIPASIIDLAVSLRTGTRTALGPSITAFARASKQAATEGLKDALYIMRRGASVEGLANLGLPQEISSGNRLLDAYVNGAFRFQSAQDAVFKSFAVRRSLEEQARLLARSEARQGLIIASELEGRAAEIVRGTNVDTVTRTSMVARAVEDAEFSTFTNSNRLVEGVDRLVSKGGAPARFARDLVAPFRKTPANVVARVLDYSPVGFVKGGARAAVRRMLDGAMTEAEQRAFAQAMGRATTGTAAIMLGYKLAERGFLTGIPAIDTEASALGVTDKDEKEIKRDFFDTRAMNEATGRTAGAIRLGNRWVEVGRYSPLGNLLVLGATIHDRWQKEQGKRGLSQGEGLPDAGTMTQEATAAGLSTVFEQPLLEATKNIVEDVGDPERAARSVIGSFIPTIAGDVAAQIDTTERSAPGRLDQAKRKIPGLRESLPARQDVLGRDIPPAGALSPVRSSSMEGRTTAALEELRRHNLMLSNPPKDAAESPAEYRARIKKLGAIRSARLDSVVNSERYHRGLEGYPLSAFQRVALQESERLAQQDVTKRRTPQAEESAMIFHNARVALELDRALEKAQTSDVYSRLGPVERKDFNDLLRSAFGRARATPTRGQSVGLTMMDAEDALGEIRDDLDELIRRAEQTATRYRDR